MKRRITGRILSIITAAALMAGGICMPAAASENQIPDSEEETVLSEEPDSEEVIEAEEDEVTEEAEAAVIAADENTEEPAETEIDDTEQGTDPEGKDTGSEGDIPEIFAEETEDALDLSDLPGGDTLFAGYVDKVFGSAGRESSKKLKSVKKAYSSLSEFGKLVYDQLHEQILSVANGTVTSTQFWVDTSSLCVHYTAADLGVSVLAENGKMTAEASKALYAAYGYDSSAISMALLLDCPYEMYWYDKTTGSKMNFSLSTTTVNGEVAVGIAGITYRMTVSKDYQGSTYNTDSSKTSAASNAASNAREVVNNNSGRADFEKLIVYKEYIFDEVSYNDDAAGNSVPYGDPWQLIYVFDGDPATNVVCEGYSKAFQYLCDQSSFDNPYRCICVTGYLSSSDGSIGERHEWNIVSAYGDNYLVDLTNSDSGTVGAPAKLFMVGMNGSADERYYKGIGKTVYYKYDDSMSGSYSSSDLTLSGDDFTDPEGWYDLSTYRTGETFTYPGKEAVIFAGWFTDSDNTSPVEETVKRGPGHAKFVDEKTIGTVYQINTGDPAKSKLRMYSSVDSLQYAYVGFHLKKSKTGDQVTTQKITKVFTSYTSGEYTITPKDYFCNDSKYLVILTLNGIPTGQNNTVTFQPFWITLDGTEVRGNEKTVELP